MAGREACYGAHNHSTQGGEPPRQQRLVSAAFMYIATDASSRGVGAAWWGGGGVRRGGVVTVGLASGAGAAPSASCVAWAPGRSGEAGLVLRPAEHGCWWDEASREGLRMLERA